MRKLSGSSLNGFLITPKTWSTQHVKSNAWLPPGHTQSGLPQAEGRCIWLRHHTQSANTTQKIKLPLAATHETRVCVLWFSRSRPEAQETG